MTCERYSTDVISQYDPKDPTSAPPQARERAQMFRKYLPNSPVPLNDIRIGVPQEYFPEELHPSILDACRSALAKLIHLGATIVPISLATTQYALSAYYVLASAEASSNLARYDGVRYGTFIPNSDGASDTANIYASTRSRGFGAEVKKRILLGTYALTAEAFDNYFLQAKRVRNLICKDFNQVFRMPDCRSSRSTESPRSLDEQVDIILHSSTIQAAPTLSSSHQSSNLDTYVQDVLTVPASLAGLPALSIPIGRAEDGWPVGISLVSQWGCDQLLLDVADALEARDD